MIRSLPVLRAFSALLAPFAASCGPFFAVGADPRPDVGVPGGGAQILSTPGLVSFWDFQESAGSPRVAKGPHPAALRERLGETARAEGGLFGPYCARIESGRYLEVPRTELGPLDIHGENAAVTLAAWIRRDSDRFWQSIAGVWDETHKKRQYMLFLNARGRTDHVRMEREPCKDLVHGHISSVGGPTPGRQVCITYASGGTPVGFDKWQMLSLAYDGERIRVHLDGRLDEAPGFNPFPYDEGIFDGGGDGAPFTVGANHVAGVENNNPFVGWIAGIAVWNRALDDGEIAALAAATLPKDGGLPE